MIETGCLIFLSSIEYPVSGTSLLTNTNLINIFTKNYHLERNGNFTPTQPSPLEGEGQGGGD
jgi:hypothetical protein